MKDIEKCCYCGHPVTIEGVYDAESGEEWEKVTPIETENKELKQRVKKLEATIAKHERREDSHMKQIDKLEAIAEYAKGFYKATVEWNEGISKIIGHGSSTGIPIGELGRALKEAGKLKVRK